jgi:DNA primase catalytic core, N-terminal domain
VYEREERELCVSDKILLKRQVKDYGIANGTPAQIEKIDRRQVTSHLLKSGESITWHVPPDQLSSIPQTDYGHATTSYSIQGASTGQTFAHLDTADPTARRLITQALFYVAASRPKYELEIYTNGTTRLRSLLTRRTEKGMALSPEQRLCYVPEEQKRALVKQRIEGKLPVWVRDDRTWCTRLGEKYSLALENGSRVTVPAANYQTQSRGQPTVLAIPIYIEKQKLLLEMHETATQISTGNWKADAVVREYLASRKITPELVEEFRLGVSRREGRQLVEAIRQYGPELMKESGLFVVTEAGQLRDRFRGRLMFPIQDPSGKIIAFAGRALSDEQERKYLNSLARNSTTSPPRF